MFEDEEVLQYVDGVAMHWYQDKNSNAEFKKYAFTDKKNIFVMNTEACMFFNYRI